MIISWVEMYEVGKFMYIIESSHTIWLWWPNIMLHKVFISKIYHYVLFIRLCFFSKFSEWIRVVTIHIFKCMWVSAVDLYTCERVCIKLRKYDKSVNTSFPWCAWDHALSTVKIVVLSFDYGPDCVSNSAVRCAHKNVL